MTAVWQLTSILTKKETHFMISMTPFGEDDYNDNEDDNNDNEDNNNDNEDDYNDNEDD